jgi:hypothetical protein
VAAEFTRGVESGLRAAKAFEAESAPGARRAAGGYASMGMLALESLARGIQHTR